MAYVIYKDKNGLFLGGAVQDKSAAGGTEVSKEEFIKTLNENGLQYTEPKKEEPKAEEPKVAEEIKKPAKKGK